MPDEFAVEVWRPDGGTRIRYRPVADGQGWWRVEERRAHGQWQVQSRERVAHVEYVSDPETEFSDYPVDIPSAESGGDSDDGPERGDEIGDGPEPRVDSGDGQEHRAESEDEPAGDVDREPDAVVDEEDGSDPSR